MSTIKDVYVDNATIKISEEDIKSDDIKKYGKRILTMAENKGKGWYAILLSKYITPSICIPKYILDAIVFAKSKFSNELIVQMLEYVLDTYNEDEEIDNLKNELKSYNEGRTSFDDIKKTLKKVLNKNELILYIKSTIDMFVWGKNDLNPEQEKAIYNENSILLIACPGSGKQEQ